MIERFVRRTYRALSKRFHVKGFASIPMDAPDVALEELHRAIDTLKLNGVILLSNIGGKPLTSSRVSAVLRRSEPDELCIFLHPMIPANSDAFREYVLGRLSVFRLIRV